MKRASSQEKGLARGADRVEKDVENALPLAGREPVAPDRLIAQMSGAGLISLLPVSHARSAR